MAAMNRIRAERFCWYRLGLVACAVLTLAGCLESPFSPEPERKPGGDCPRPSDEVAFDCKLDCPGLQVEAAASCATPFEGLLDADGRRCTFSDGSVATFDPPLVRGQSRPNPSADTRVELRRNGERCLLWQQRNVYPNQSLRSTLQLTSSCYQQELFYKDALRLDGGSIRPDAVTGGSEPPALSAIEMWCGGRLYRADNPCGGCEQQSCSNLPVVVLKVLQSGDVVDVSLVANRRQTPLFNCRWR
jgi:hypothetical protein